MLLPLAFDETTTSFPPPCATSSKDVFSGLDEYRLSDVYRNATRTEGFSRVCMFPVAIQF